MSPLNPSAEQPSRGPADAAGPAGHRAARRHGRTPSRTVLPGPGLRSLLVRLAVLPAALVLLVCTAAFAALLHAGPGAGPLLRLGVPAVASAAAALLVLWGGAVAGAQARELTDRCIGLRHESARGRTRLYTLLDRLRAGEEVRPRPPGTVPYPTGDEIDLLAHEMERSRRSAEAVLIEAAALSRDDGHEEKVEVFVNLARRLQSLVHREIQLLDALENEVEDPDLLKGLFHVDHLATRIRRHAENLAVLGGAVSRRQWTRPVAVTEVLRSATAEVEQYPRVKLVPPIVGTVQGHAVADVIHLVAELVENATVFSAPHTQVLLRTEAVAAGLAVEVEDRGLGMSAADRMTMNALLADPDRVDVAELVQDGRIGLFVVATLARRHGVVVRLQSNIYGGTQAVLVLPTELLGTDTGTAAQAPAATTGQATAAPATTAAPASTAALPGTPPASGTHLPPPAPLTPHTPSAHRGATPADDATGATDAPGPAVPAPPAPAVPAAGPSSLRPVGGAGTWDALDDTTLHTVLRGDPDPEHGPVHGGRSTGGRPADGPPPLPHRPGPLPSVVPPRPPAVSPAPRPVAETVRGTGTGDRPRLPRRRRQEHPAPQPRHQLPAARPAEEYVGHDPGLMAAFRRGVSLADEPDTDTP
ncbi:sensor histidine kinase [Streptomyces sp. HB2AG]|uniref:sensor histidine kinase n=1 Tax=Streptomyces sp. HB2AG TaxID=2983400 RepID=UPI0022AA19CC|nr:ATP-binding protein [Streptomyces sp. HB2AG]MCZ2525331.1 ATP-binding protein [Streptomyces sp. HB2AG]